MQERAFNFFGLLKDALTPTGFILDNYMIFVDAVIVLQQCDQGTARNRSRHILRLPASENSACPELVQSEPCVLNSTCFTYQYGVSGRTICTATSG